MPGARPAIRGNGVQRGSSRGHSIGLINACTALLPSVGDSGSTAREASVPFRLLFREVRQRAPADNGHEAHWTDVPDELVLPG